MGIERTVFYRIGKRRSRKRSLHQIGTRLVDGGIYTVYSIGSVADGDGFLFFE